MKVKFFKLFVNHKKKKEIMVEIAKKNLNMLRTLFCSLM